MVDTKQELVTVTMQNGKLTCNPDWVHLFWKDGPRDIRWAFVDLPKDVVGAMVKFLVAVPTKYVAPSPGTPGPFRPRGVHNGFGCMPASLGSQLPDFITEGNTQEIGYFYYNVTLLDAAGEIITQVDPGGDNQPIP